MRKNHADSGVARNGGAGTNRLYASFAVRWHGRLDAFLAECFIQPEDELFKSRLQDALVRGLYRNPFPDSILILRPSLKHMLYFHYENLDFSRESGALMQIGAERNRVDAAGNTGFFEGLLSGRLQRTHGGFYVSFWNDPPPPRDGGDEQYFEPTVIPAVRDDPRLPLFVFVYIHMWAQNDTAGLLQCLVTRRSFRRV